MGTVLEVFSDLSERLNYNLPDFPLYVRRGALYQFDRYAAACHWHSDLEFILVLQGSMEYYVNGQTVKVDERHGIFVNSKRMHYGFSSEMADCTFLVAAVHPLLLGAGTNTGKDFFETKFGPGMDDFLLLNPDCPWQKDALILIEKIFGGMHEDTPDLLVLLAQAAALCAAMGEHVKPLSEHLADDQWMTVWKMTGFIHRHYDQKISLEDIASAGAVCRSRCCELFGRYIGQTPNTYVIRYRLQKSCEMLRETGRSICEIALACGFQSASYFSHVFHRHMGCIPQDYRRQMRDSSAPVS